MPSQRPNSPSTPEMSAAPPLWRDLLLLALLALVVYLPGIGSRDLWNPDEPRYAVVAREMLDTGTVEAFMVPHLNGKLYTQKPPLLFWSMAASSLPFGDVSEITARMPSLLAAIAAILGVFRLGLLFFDRRAAWLSALIFGTVSKIIWQGHVGQIDMLLTALVVWSVFYWAKAYVQGETKLYWLYFVFAGLATMAKGPVGLLPPLLSIVLFLAWRDRQGLRAFPVFRGLLLWAAVVLTWLGPALYWGGEVYQQEILFKQNVTRYVEPWHHYQPPYYYLGVLPTDFLPWSLLAPAALLAAYRLLRGEQRERWRFLCVWVLTTLVFFSLSPGKRTVYILTLYPAMALLTGAGLDLIARRRQEIVPAMSRLWLRIPALFLTTLIALIGIAAFVVGPRRKEVAVLGEDLPALLGVAFLALAAGLAWATRELWRERIERFVAIQAAAFALFMMVAWTFILPRLDVVKSARGLSARLLEEAKAGEPYGIFPRLDPTFLFYTRRHAVELGSAEEVQAFSETGPVFLLAERHAWNELETQPPFYEIARDQDEASGYLLLTNQAP